jgi:hypothetical protein
MTKPEHAIRVVEGGRRALCRGCGAKIVWVRTIPNLRPIPFDRDPQVVEDTGCRNAGARVVWVSTDDTHWRTCPKAAKFHRRRDGEDA